MFLFIKFTMIKTIANLCSFTLNIFGSTTLSSSSQTQQPINMATLERNAQTETTGHTKPQANRMCVCVRLAVQRKPSDNELNWTGRWGKRGAGVDYLQTNNPS